MESIKNHKFFCSLITRPTSWDNHEGTFRHTLHELKQKRVDFGVFGDIDLEE